MPDSSVRDGMCCRMCRRSRRGLFGGGGRCQRVGVVWLVAAVLALVGCSGSQHDDGGEDRLDSQPATAGDASGAGSEAGAADRRDPRELSDIELNEGPGVLELSAAKLVQELGVLGFLEAYIIDIPPTARFITDFETSKAGLALSYLEEEPGTDYVKSAFESEVFYQTGAATSSLLEGGGSQVLHDEFFAALENCGRDSQWPGVELFVMGDGRGYDVGDYYVTGLPFGLSWFEYLELRHQCARHAVTYPGLDETLRDELLAPQRAHYARALIDGLADNPHIEVPARYHAEWDQLVTQGW